MKIYGLVQPWDIHSKVFPKQKSLGSRLLIHLWTHVVAA